MYSMRCTYDHCDRTFTPTVHNRMFCSDRCKKRASRNSQAGSTRRCASCSTEFVVTWSGQKFCSQKCQSASHWKQPKKRARIKQRTRDWLRQHRKTDPEFRKRDRETNRKAEYKRYHTDAQYRLRRCLRSRLTQAFKSYAKNGKVKPAKDYGIDYQAIIEHLGPRPSDKHVVDHIVPLKAFNFDLRTHVKAAFAPENHQWLLPKKNGEKSSTYCPALRLVLLQRYQNTT